MQAPKQSEFPLHDADFRHIAALVRNSAGIVLSDRKRDLVYNRLSRRLRALRIDSFGAYCTYLDSPEGADELGALINAITTNLTAFFREEHHFDHLRTAILDPLVGNDSADRRIRIWSAGCSTGEEPYSIAMVLREALGNTGSWDARILATDIDTEVLAKARLGNYTRDNASAIPKSLRDRHTQTAPGDNVAMADSIRRLITFKQLNLFSAWPMRGPFDAIFCRNVIIYFDKAQQRILFEGFAEMLSEDGFLYIGHSESLHGVSERFELLGRTVYRRVR